MELHLTILSMSHNGIIIIEPTLFASIFVFCNFDLDLKNFFASTFHIARRTTFGPASLLDP